MSEPSRIEQRSRRVRRSLRQRHAGFEPDPGFAGRVLARLPRQGGPDALGWAAGRLVTVGLVLALALGWLAWRQTTASPADPAEALGRWVVAGLAEAE